MKTNVEEFLKVISQDVKKMKYFSNIIIIS